MDLNGIWDFAFFPDRSLEEIEPKKVVFTGVMPVPGCYEEFTGFRRGTGVYRRTFELKKEEPRPVLRVEGAGQRVRFFLDGKRKVDFPPFPYSVMEKELPPLREGVHELVANALVMKGEAKRTMDLRQEDLPNVEADDAEEQGE